jgi:hypothetical protein
MPWHRRSVIEATILDPLTELGRAKHGLLLDRNAGQSAAQPRGGILRRTDIPGLLSNPPVVTKSDTAVPPCRKAATSRARRVSKPWTVARTLRSQPTPPPRSCG